MYKIIFDMLEQIAIAKRDGKEYATFSIKNLTLTKDEQDFLQGYIMYILDKSSDMQYDNYIIIYFD